MSSAPDPNPIAPDPKDAKIADLEKQIRIWRLLTWFLVIFVASVLIFILISQVVMIGTFKWAVQNEIDNVEYIKKLHEREINELKR